MKTSKSSNKGQIAREIREFLLSLPLAKSSPMLNYESLVKELSFFEGLISGLKAFIKKLSALSASEYLRWMHDAFSNVSMGSLSKSKHANVYDSTQDIPEYPTQNPTHAPASTKRKSKKRKQALSIS
ncbi:MAG: hypothetical protein AB7V32_02415 [Candidatus Berkiella sp.]